jgi:hypothetical protein
LDAQGYPHVSYTSQGLKYAYYDGSSWHRRLLIDDHLVGHYNSIALDQAGRPHISFSEWSYPDEMWLRYAYFDGFDWQIETVDTQTGSGWYQGTSLALDDQDYPHIAYWNSQLEDLRYAAYRDPCTGIDTAEIAGPGRLPVGINGQYAATYTPPDATVPVIYAWEGDIFEATAVYSWTEIGNYTVAVTVTNLCGQAQDTFPVEVFCQPVEGLSASGPLALQVDQSGTYRANIQPITASLPMTITWSDGDSGPTAVYNWAMTGTYTLTVTATNLCGDFQVTTLQVRVLAEWPYKAHLPLVLRNQALP